MRGTVIAPEQDGNDERENDDILEGAGPEGRVGFDETDEQRAAGRQRIGGKTADDGGNEGLEADQEAGVEIDRRHWRDEQAGNRADQPGEKEGECARAFRADADQPRTGTVEGRGAQGLADESAAEEQSHDHDERDRDGDDENRLRLDRKTGKPDDAGKD